MLLLLLQLLVISLEAETRAPWAKKLSDVIDWISERLNASYEAIHISSYSCRSVERYDSNSSRVYMGFLCALASIHPTHRGRMITTDQRKPQERVLILC